MSDGFRVGDLNQTQRANLRGARSAFARSGNTTEGLEPIYVAGSDGARMESGFYLDPEGRIVDQERKQLDANRLRAAQRFLEAQEKGKLFDTQTQQEVDDAASGSGSRSTSRSTSSSGSLLGRTDETSASEGVAPASRASTDEELAARGDRAPAVRWDDPLPQAQGAENQAMGGNLIFDNRGDANLKLEDAGGGRSVNYVTAQNLNPQEARAALDRVGMEVPAGEDPVSFLSEFLRNQKRQ